MWSRVVRLPVHSQFVNFSHFRLLLWNRYTEFYETWQESRTQHPLPSLCFSDRSEKQDGRPGLWLAERFWTSLKPLSRFFSTKLDRKQDVKVLYQVCVFRADRKNKMAALAHDWLRHFRLLLWNRWTEFNEIWQEARSQLLYQVCVFRADRRKKMAALASDWADTYRTSPPETAERNSTKLDRKQNLNVLNQVCVFWADRKTRCPPWPLIGWYIYDFSKTAERNLTHFDRKQDLNILYQVCVFRDDKKTRWPSLPLIGWDIFDFSSETAELNSTKLDRKHYLNVLYQVCVFRADRKNKMTALASDWLRHLRLLLWNHWTEF